MYSSVFSFIFIEERLRPDDFMNRNFFDGKSDSFDVSEIQSVDSDGGGSSERNTDYPIRIK